MTGNPPPNRFIVNDYDTALDRADRVLSIDGLQSLEQYAEGQTAALFAIAEALGRLVDVSEQIADTLGAIRTELAAAEVDLSNIEAGLEK